MHYKLLVEKRVRGFLKKLKREKKQYVQIVERLLDLIENPYPQDVKKIKGEEKSFLRVDVGEFRIVYTVKKAEKTVYIILIERRNDDEVYKILERL